LDRYRIGTDTGCIVSNCFGYFCMGETCISAGLAAVNGSHYCEMIKGRSRPVTAASVVWLSTTREGVGGAGGRRL